MRGLTVILAEPAPARGRAALTLATAHAALGGRTRLFFHEGAVGLLVPGEDAGDPALAAAGLPNRAALLDMAGDAGVALIACQTGLAVAGIHFQSLVAGAQAGGMVGLLATLDDDRLLFV